MSLAFLIARKDLRSYFTSASAYVIMGVFLLLVGWMYRNLFSYFASGLTQFTQFNMGTKPNLNEALLRPLFGNVNVVLLFVAPFITMRLIAEEKKDHTLELLVTAPVKASHIVFGKFFAGTGMVLAMVGGTLLFPILLHMVGRPDWGVILTCYLGVALVSATYVAIGLFWSSVTEHQMIAALLTFGNLLFLWLLPWAAHSAGPIIGDVLTGLSLISHFTSFSQGVIDTYDIVFYVTFTGFALFLTHLTFESN